jgi:hypothetical protein
LLPQRKKKNTSPNRISKQSNATAATKQNKTKTNTQTKQSTRSSALTALVGSENGVFWYFGHTTRVGFACLGWFSFEILSKYFVTCPASLTMSPHYSALLLLLAYLLAQKW